MKVNKLLTLFRDKPETLSLCYAIISIQTSNHKKNPSSRSPSTSYPPVPHYTLHPLPLPSPPPIVIINLPHPLKPIHPPTRLRLPQRSQPIDLITIPKTMTLTINNNRLSSRNLDLDLPRALIGRIGKFPGRVVLGPFRQEGPKGGEAGAYDTGGDFYAGPDGTVDVAPCFLGV